MLLGGEEGMHMVVMEGCGDETGEVALGRWAEWVDGFLWTA